MRTNSLRHSRAPRTRLIIVGSVLGVCGILFFFSGILGGVGSYLTQPFSVIRVWFLSSNIPLLSYPRSLSVALSENQSLHESLERAQYDGVRLAVLEEENKKLRNLMHDSSLDVMERIVASVVRRPSETPYDTLLVGRGSSDGVQEGALVYAGKDEGQSVIGAVARVFPYSALVVLFSTPGMESPVYVYGADVFARAQGMGGGVVRIGVPQGVPIAVGNPVVIPAESSGVYGTIAYIESDPSNPEQYGFVTELPAISTLRYVAIDTNPLAHISFEDATKVVEALRAQESTSTPLGALMEILPIASTTSTTSESR